MRVTQLLSLGKHSIVGDEWLLGEDKYRFSTVVLQQPTTLYMFEKKSFPALHAMLGVLGLEAWRDMVKVGTAEQSRHSFREQQTNEVINSIQKIADRLPISHSPSSFARVRVKKAGLECESDRKVIKPFEKEMTKLIGHKAIVKKEELMLVDLVVGKGQQAAKLSEVEDKVVTHLNKKKAVATAILKDTDHLKEMSEV